jgi:hypothetical protein
MISKGKIRLHNRWGFLECDHELGKYYRKLYRNHYYGCRKLQRPSNAEHITIFSPWDEIDLSGYHRFNGKELEFEVFTKPFTNGNAVWYPVYSMDIRIFRMRLGAASTMGKPVHFCLGYQASGYEFSGVEEL